MAKKSGTIYHGKIINASALHRRVWSLLRELFPQYTLLENEPVEVHLGGRDTTLYIDVLVKELGLAVEAHGRQHFEPVAHFHQGRKGFGESVQRDQAKAQAIEQAGLSYLMIPYTEEQTLTSAKLLKRINKAIGA